MQFSTSFNADGYAAGKYFTDFQLAELALIYDAVGTNAFKNLLMSGKARNKAKPPAESPGAIAADLCDLEYVGLELWGLGRGRETFARGL